MDLPREYIVLKSFLRPLCCNAQCFYLFIFILFLLHILRSFLSNHCAAMPDVCSKWHNFFRFCWTSWICSSVLKKYRFLVNLTLMVLCKRLQLELQITPSCFCIWSLFPQKKLARRINWINPSWNWCTTTARFLPLQVRTEKYHGAAGYLTSNSISS